MYHHGFLDTPSPYTHHVSFRGRHKPSRSLSSNSTTANTNTNTNTAGAPLTLRHQRHHSLLHHRRSTHQEKQEKEKEKLEKEKEKEKEKKEKQHRHHHHHHGHHHRRDRPHNERSPQSAGAALQLGRHSLDVTRADRGSPYLTPDASRRHSFRSWGILNGTGSNSNGPANETAVLLGQPPHPTMSIKPEEELRLGKDKAAAQIVGLKKSLVDLGTFSNTTTRRLDETYYAVLEKTSMLQNTVTAMKELALLTREMKENFEKESGEMVREVQGQLEGIGGFEEQETRIKDLQERIEANRGRIKDLSERVDVVKHRIEGWERSDLEWQERTRKRLRKVWLIVSCVVALLVLLLVGVRFAPPSSETKLLDGPRDAAGVGEGEGAPPVSLLPGQSRDGDRNGDEGNQSRLRPADSDSRVDDRPGLPLWKERDVDREDRLRFLDEL